MLTGMIGKKAGSTRLLNEDGSSTHVTVIYFEENVVCQVKSKASDGYTAVQIATGAVKKQNKPRLGHFKKYGINPKRTLREFKLQDGLDSEFNSGDVLSIDDVPIGTKVSVTARSKGKGFQGGMKRHNFSGQNASHGNSLAHRKIGSIGQCQDPGKVFKGKKMPGQMGNKRVTVKNLEVVKVDSSAGWIMVKGAVPGAVNGMVVVMLPAPDKQEG